MAKFGPEYEGREASHPDGRVLKVINGDLVQIRGPNLKGAGGPAVGGPGRPTKDDEKAMTNARDIAQAERDAQRRYGGASRALMAYDAGPLQRWADDVFLPGSGDGKDNGPLKGIGGALYAPLRDKKELEARSFLKTLEADTTLAKTQMIKGAASNLDAATARLAGMNLGSTRAENMRKVKDAEYQSGLSQVRANVTSTWIARVGSLSRAARSGLTYDKLMAQPRLTMTPVCGSHRPARVSRLRLHPGNTCRARRRPESASSSTSMGM